MSEKKHTLDELYGYVFETIDDLKADKIDINKAAEIRNQIQTAVNVGKLECRYIEVAGGVGSRFISQQKEPLASRDRLRMIDRSSNG